MRAKRAEKSSSQYSIRSFLHGFACATFLSYFGFLFYFSTTGEHFLYKFTLMCFDLISTNNFMFAGNSLPTVDHSSSAPFVRPAEEINAVVNEIIPIFNNQAEPVIAKVVPVESRIPSLKSHVSNWNLVGAEKGEPLQGGPFTSKDLVLGTNSAPFTSLSCQNH